MATSGTWTNFVAGSSGTWYYSGTTLTVSGTGEMDNYLTNSLRPWDDCIDTVTSIVVGQGITRVGDNAFGWAPKLRYISLPTTLISIGEWAFAHVGDYLDQWQGINGVSVVLPEGLTTVEANAFSGNITHVTFPSTLTRICKDAFNSCELSQIELPDIVGAFLDIGEGAFANNKLTSVHIPTWCFMVGEGAFAANPLTSITCSSMRYSVVDGVLFNSDKTILLQYPCASTSSTYTVPDGVTKLGEGCFRCSNNLTEIHLPTSLTVINSYAFSGCDVLDSITIPDSVILVGLGAVRSCHALRSVTLSSSMFAIPESFASNCESLTEVIIPDSITSIGEWAFAWCESLTEIDIPKNVTTIGSMAFHDCHSLEKVNIPAGVTVIESSLFSDCYALTSLTLHKGITEIEYGAFAYSGLTELIMMAKTPPVIGKKIFEYTPNTAPTIYVPYGHGDVYKAADGWSEYAEYIVESDPAINLKSWLMGLALGMAGNPLPFTLEPPIAYIFNGVELPPLPKWDREKYPYAQIQYDNIIQAYEFTALSADAYYFYSSDMLLFGGESADNPVEGVVCHCYKPYDTWDELKVWDNCSVAINKLPWGKLIWQNFDAEYEGVRYMEASDPIPVYAGSSDPEKTPTSYSYNGVVLPKLPEWDREKYPYAVIGSTYKTIWVSGVPAGTRYVFVVFKSTRYKSASGGGFFFTVPAIEWVYYNNEWVKCKEFTEDNSTESDDGTYFSSIMYGPDWADHDVYNSDGTLYLAASEPTPVYE